MNIMRVVIFNNIFLGIEKLRCRDNVMIRVHHSSAARAVPVLVIMMAKIISTQIASEK